MHIEVTVRSGRNPGGRARDVTAAAPGGLRGSLVPERPFLSHLPCAQKIWCLCLGRRLLALVQGCCALLSFHRLPSTPASGPPSARAPLQPINPSTHQSKSFALDELRTKTRARWRRDMIMYSVKGTVKRHHQANRSQLLASSFSFSPPLCCEDHQDFADEFTPEGIKYPESNRASNSNSNTCFSADRTRCRSKGANLKDQHPLCPLLGRVRSFESINRYIWPFMTGNKQNAWRSTRCLESMW